MRPNPAIIALLGCVLLSPPRYLAGEPVRSSPPAMPADSSTAASSPQDLAASSDLFAIPTTLDHVGRIVVPVSINGRGPFRFVVDTGASHSTISPTLLGVLGLHAVTSVELNGITGSKQVPAVSIDRLTAGDVTISDSILPVVWAPLMAGADGILGLAGTKGSNLLVDFERNRVILTRATVLREKGDLMRLHAARVTGGLLTFDARVGRVPVRAVVDTGAERSLGNLALRDALHARGMNGPKFKTTVYGATNDVVSAEIQTAPTIVIDTLRIVDTAVVFGDFHIFRIWGLQDRPALILGMDVLGTVGTLAIDFDHQNVLIASPAVGEGGAAAMSTRSLQASDRRSR